MSVDNCIFCKILADEIPSSVVYEDDMFRAIILPKKHAANIFELPDEEASKILIVARKIAKALKETYHCDGVNILQNNGEAAGQTVFHLHVHVIPRFEGDTDHINIGWKPGETPADLQEIAEAIKANL